MLLHLLSLYLDIESWSIKLLQVTEQSRCCVWASYDPPCWYYAGFPRFYYASGSDAVWLVLLCGGTQRRHELQQCWSQDYRFPTKASQLRPRFISITAHFSKALRLIARNFMVEWLILRILKVPDSKLGPETGYPDWGFSLFASVAQD
jgi:hypothetical protein